MGNQPPSVIEQEKAKKLKIMHQSSHKSNAELDESTRVSSIEPSTRNQMDDNKEPASFVNESLLGKPDFRTMVPDNTIQPYCGIGKIEVEFENKDNHLTLRNEVGTGFLISKEHFMTAYHVFVFEGYKIKNIYFCPEPLSQSDVSRKQIKAEIVIWDERYLAANIKDKRPYDYAVLKLEPNSIIKQEHSLKCNFNYQFQKDKRNPVNVPGYPSQQQLKILMTRRKYNNKYALFYDQKTPYQQIDYRLQYQNQTSPGTSGAPLLMKIQSSSVHSYEVVGVHICGSGKRNAGILLSKLNLKQQILTLISLAHSPQSASPKVSLEIQQPISKFSDTNQIKNINNEQLAALAVNGHKFPQLQTIYLEYNKITDAGLEALAVNGHKFPQLQTIDLRYNQITDAGLEALAVNGHKFPQLQTIYLWGNAITDAGLEALAVNGHKFPQLQEIDLGGNKITDAGLEALAVNGHKFPQLQKIGLNGDKITDAGLEALAVNGHKFPQLQKIYLRANQISQESSGSKLHQIVKLKDLKVSQIKVYC